MLACLFSQLAALKVLVAGEFEKDKRAWFNSVVQHLAMTDSDPTRMIYFLDSRKSLSSETKVSEKVTMYGIGTEHDFQWDLAS